MIQRSRRADCWSTVRLVGRGALMASCASRLFMIIRRRLVCKVHAAITNLIDRRGLLRNLRR